MKENQLRIAILDDDAALLRLLRFLLEKEFQVLTPGNGAQLCRLVDEDAVDAILLDIGLPDEDGIAIAKRIRITSNIPIIFLSGQSSDEMIIKGLNIGGDDYVTKPFQSEVLLARVRSALRHSAEHVPAQPLLNIKLGEVTFEVRDQRLVKLNGQLVKLTEMEALILSTLVQADNQMLSREEMFRRVYGREWDLLNRGLEVHLSHLRRKLTMVSGVENPIVGVRGIGYRLNLEQANPPQDGDGF
ncbi:MAG: response regulator transcription factor [Comamonadaceae bacterium]